MSTPDVGLAVVAVAIYLLVQMNWKKYWPRKER